MRALVAVALGCCACSNNFDPASYVNKLRLLAVKAEPPDIPLGATTTLTATVANPGGSAPTVDWDACLLPPPPASGQAVNQDCIGLDGGAALVSFGSGLTVTATMPQIDASMVGLPDQTNGIYLQIRERLAADGKQLVGFYGLRIYLGALLPNPPNKNPVFAGVYTIPVVDAGAAEQVPLEEANPPTVSASGQVLLRALVTPDSQETFVVFDGDPRTTPPRSETEKVRMHWFSTAGTFSNEVTGVDKPETLLTFEKRTPSPGSTIDLWVVARDDRGGLDVVHRTLQIR
jgi:hypothetical protein